MRRTLIDGSPAFRVRRDTRRERGSVVGIHTAIADAAAGDIVLVVAWDMPFVSAHLLAFLVARARAGRDRGDP